MTATIPKSTKISLNGVGSSGRALARAGQRLDEEVAGVRVGVDEVVDEDLLQIGLIEPFRHLTPINPCGLDGRQVADLDIGDVLQRKDATGGILPVNGGDVHAVVTGEVAREVFGVVPLGDKIHLGARGARKLIVDLIEIGLAADRAVELEPVLGDADGGQIGFDDARDAGPLNFDDHVFTAGQPREMDLRQRRRGFGPGLKLLEDLAGGPAEFLEDHGLHVFRPLRRHLVLQAGQFAGDRLRQDVYADAEELAQLDEHAAQLDG